MLGARMFPKQAVAVLGMTTAEAPEYQQCLLVHKGVPRRGEGQVIERDTNPLSPGSPPRGGDHSCRAMRST